MIEVINLYKQYGAVKVLENINIRFEKGGIYGIVGENGAGKTTLFRCIAGLEVYQGQIISDTAPLKNYIGFLPPEPYFFSKMTAKEYIRLLANARKRKIDDIDSKNIFDLPLNRYVSEYSTGMKKKLAILAILLQDNAYFILDEPFNGIDIQGNLIITEIIHKLKTLNKTVILSSHIFSTLTETCDEICLLHEGKLCSRVQRNDFCKLESEMKSFLIGRKIDKILSNVF
jgi:ABC-2 type transport system ATP-binding protein